MRQKLIFFLALLGTILAFEAKALNENESGIAASAAKEYNIHGKITDASGDRFPMPRSLSKEPPKVSYQEPTVHTSLPDCAPEPIP